MNPLQGDYAVVPVGGQVGRLIRVGQWLNGDGFRNYEHAEIYVGLPDKAAPLGYTMGAYPGGARLKPVPRHQNGWLWSTGHIPLTDRQRNLLVTAALGCRGVPYSSLDYFALAAHRLHIPAPHLRAFIESSGHMICSQLVDYCYSKAGVPLFTDNRWCGYVTPEDLANRILE